MATIATEKDDVVEIETPQIPAIPFAISLPASTLQRLDDDPLKTDNDNTVSLIGDNGIVGSIVLLNNALIVWVGWGTLNLTSTSEDLGLHTTQVAFGKGIPVMGQLVVSMPRTNYKGSFGGTGNSAGNASCSHIIGSANSDDQMLASQMASRLSTKSGKAVFVSCQLSAAHSDNSWTAGLDSETIAHRAAAMAEKEIWRILQE